MLIQIVGNSELSLFIQILDSAQKVGFLDASGASTLNIKLPNTLPDNNTLSPMMAYWGVFWTVMLEPVFDKSQQVDGKSRERRRRLQEV